MTLSEKIKNTQEQTNYGKFYFFKKYIYFTLSIYACAWAHHIYYIYAEAPRVRKGTRCPRTGATNGSKVWYGCRKLNLSPLQGPWVLCWTNSLASMLTVSMLLVAFLKTCKWISKLKSHLRSFESLLIH